MFKATVSAQKATMVFTPIPGDGRATIGAMLEEQWSTGQQLRPETPAVLAESPEQPEG